MNRRWLYSLILLGACDSTDVGRPDEPAGPPKVLSVLVQDETHIAQRSVVTDILLEGTPLASCSMTNPCPAELGAADPSQPDFCVYPDSELEKAPLERVGSCPDPFNPAVNPVFVGGPLPEDYLPSGYDGPNSGNQLRVVFNKLLDPALDAALRADGQTIVTLSDRTGALDVLAYYDAAGVALRVAYPPYEPAGPAIVIKPLAPLFASTRYTLTLDSAQVKARDGTAAQPAGPFAFTTEAAFPAGGQAPAGDLHPDDALSFYFNAAVTTATTVVTSSTAVRRVEGDTLVDVPVMVFVNGYCDPSASSLLHVVPTSSITGEPSEWVEGEYEYDLSALGASAGPDGGALASSPFGDPLSGSFVVVAPDPESASENPAADLSYVCE